MNKRILMLFITVGIGIPAALVGRVIWPPADHIISPTVLELAPLILLEVIQALLFGFGMAYMLLYWSEVRRDEQLAFLSLVWLMISWWPHGLMHLYIDDNYLSLIAVEYGYHLTAIIATVIVAKNFLRRMSFEALEE